MTGYEKSPDYGGDGGSPWRGFVLLVIVAAALLLAQVWAAAS